MKKSKIDTEAKRIQEQETVEEMIKLYCRKNHGGRYLCDECRELLEYSKERSARCPFMEEKTFCNNCKVHCYKPEMRERIRKVMRYAGPRMLFVHPVMAIRHVYYDKKEKLKMKNEK